MESHEDKTKVIRVDAGSFVGLGFFLGDLRICGEHTVDKTNSPHPHAGGGTERTTEDATEKGSFLGAFNRMSPTSISVDLGLLRSRTATGILNRTWGKLSCRGLATLSDYAP